MYLQKIEIQGFKSFAEKTIFEFGEGITAIVGPNGSGKSNTADAVRWVLGEQSLKLLRGKKSADVIYHGSSKHARVGMAQVDLYLNNEDHRLAVDFSEVVISRRLYRSGESEYMLNGKNVTLGEVLLLLAKANFGQKSYAVIGQGMIENVLNAAPHQRKNFFDEAAGVKQYQMKRDQSLHKLLRSEENLKQTEALIAEMEPRMRMLSRQVKKLERREVLEKELHILKIDYYGAQWYALAHDIQVAQQEYETHHERKNEISQKLTAVTKKLESFTEEKSRNEIYDRLQEDIRQLQKEKNEWVKQETILEGRMQLQEEKQGKMNVVWFQDKKKEITEQRLALQENIRNTHNMVVELQRALSEILGSQKKNNERMQKTEYALLKLREKNESGSELTLKDVHEGMNTLYARFEHFLGTLTIATNTDALPSIRAEAGKIASFIATLLDRFQKQDDKKHFSENLQNLQKELQKFTENKEYFLGEVQKHKVAIETHKNKLSFLEEQYKQHNAEYEKISQEIRTISLSLASTDQETKMKQYHEEKIHIAAALNGLEGEIQSLQQKVRTFNDAEQEKKENLFRWQHENRTLQDEMNHANQRLQEIQISIARTETKQEDLKQTFLQDTSPEMQEKIFSYAVRRDDIHVLENRIGGLKRQLELIGGIDPETMKEYEDGKSRYEFLVKGRDDLKIAMTNLEKIIDELDITIKKHFDTSFRSIAEYFGKYFIVLFGGGEAKLRLLTEEMTEQEEILEGGEEQSSGPALAEETQQLDEEVEHTEAVQHILQKKKKVVSGIEIEAVPPGKKLRHVQALSGGEKALTSLALLAAILATNPPPFVMLDEVEAALDEANSEKFAAILEQLSKDTQFIVVTHNRVTMSHADILYGVTLGHDGASHILSLKLEEAKRLEAAGKIKTIA